MVDKYFEVPADARFSFDVAVMQVRSAELPCKHTGIPNILWLIRMTPLVVAIALEPKLLVLLLFTPAASY
jgi:hypothetical protein